MPDVLPRRWPARATQVHQFGPRPAVPIPTMASQSAGGRSEEIKMVPQVPLSHPFVERLIGTIRREYLDRVLFWTTADLEQKLLEFKHYYDSHRVHAGLGGRVLEPISDGSGFPISFDSYCWQTHCRGLYETPIAA